MNYIMQLVNNHNAYKKNIVPATIFFVSVIIIWCITPLITIQGHVPFAHESKRIYLILLGLLGWIAKTYFIDPKKEKKPTIASVNPDFDRKIHLLEGQLQGVMNFFKKTELNPDHQKIKLSQLPWYLVLGPKNAGKTTLLANSTINYVLKKQIKLEDIKHISSSEHCGWWVTKDTVLVDVPGNYLTQNTKSNPLWTHFLALLKNFMPANTLNGIILTLPLSDLIDREKRQILENNLRANIVALRNKFGVNLPFYFVVTKCDLLPGFVDFFGDCGSDELSQAWGITIPNAEQESITHVFTQRFNALIKRLNKQLIWRLHQERDFNQRVHIKNFPLQIEHLKEILLTLITSLSSHDNLCLHGAYLTSATQYPAHDNSNQHVHLSPTDSQHALQIMYHPTMPSRSYFIRQFITQGLARNIAQLSEPTWYKQPLIYAISGTAIVFMFIFISYDLQSSTPDYAPHILKRQPYAQNDVVPIERRIEVPTSRQNF